MGVFVFSTKKDFINKRKKPFVAAALALFFGAFGIHRFYLKRKNSACLFLGITFSAFVASINILYLLWMLLSLYCFAESIFYFLLGVKRFIYLRTKKFRKRKAINQKYKEHSKKNLKKSYKRIEKSLIRETRIKKTKPKEISRGNIDGGYQNTILNNSIEIMKDSIIEHTSKSSKKNNEIHDRIDSIKLEQIENSISAKNMVSQTNDNIYEEIKPQLQSGAKLDFVIDVTDEETTPIDFSKDKIFELDQQKEVNWLKFLEIPYERKSMGNKQIKEETLAFYQDLCSNTDKILRRRGTTLQKEIKRVYGTTDRYSDLTYTFYCISEGHVTSHYLNKGFYNNDFSYEILENKLGKQVKEMVYNSAIALETSISRPNHETIREFNLNKNGLTKVWWDLDGDIRKKSILSNIQKKILQITPPRNTKIFKYKKVKNEILTIYLKYWEIILKEINQNHLNSAATKDIQNILIKNTSLNSDTLSQLMIALLKLAENTIRESLPKTSLTQSLDIADELIQIQNLLSKNILDRLLIQQKIFKKSLSFEKISELISEFDHTGTLYYKAKLNQILSSKDDRAWESLILKFQFDTDYVNLLNDVLKKTKDTDLKLVCLTELGKSRQLSEFQKKNLYKLVYEGNNLEVENYLKSSKNMKLNHEQILKILDFKAPIRKIIKLDKAQIEVSKEKFTETMKVIDEFIGESQSMLDMPPNENPLGQKGTNEFKNDIAENDFQSKYTLESLALLKELVTTKKLSIEEIDKRAKIKGKSLRPYLKEINQNFFCDIDDQLILMDDYHIWIDEFYLDYAEELLKND